MLNNNDAPNMGTEYKILVDYLVKNHTQKLKLIESEIWNCIDKDKEKYSDIKPIISEYVEKVEVIRSILMENLIRSVENHDLLSNKAFDLEQKVVVDYLTNLNTRTFFMQSFPSHVNKNIRNNTPFSLLMVDLDAFKNINDTYGHLIGDNILEATALSIKTILRNSDIIARYGGEEFIILLPDTDIDGSLFVGEKIRLIIDILGRDEKEKAKYFEEYSGEYSFSEESLKKIGEEIRIIEKKIEDKHFFEKDDFINALRELTISIGVTTYIVDDLVIQEVDNKPDYSKLLMNLIQRADKALYKSKFTGRNVVTANTPFK